MAGGGFGFGLLTDVQMVGFYQARHRSAGGKPFLAYVLQVATSSAHFLVYRRYSQVAALAAKLHFHPPVGLPPKYALQVFPLSDAQLQQRFDGLRAFLRAVVDHLARQHAAGMHHDAQSSAGLDMQIFCDFVAHHRNRPPRPARGELPDWARPETAANWADADSVTDSEDVGLLESDGDDVEDHGEQAGDASARFRNEVLQAEGNLSALWYCVRAYMQATTAWWGATQAVLDEYKRVADMSLRKSEDDGRTHAARLVKALAQMLEAVQPEFDKKCEDAVLTPLEQLSRDVLPEVKHTYWTRHNNSMGEDTAREVNVRRLQQERETLHAKLRADVQSSMTALVALQNEMLAAMHDQLHGFERVERMPRQRSQSQPVLNRRNSRRGRGSISFAVSRAAQSLPHEESSAATGVDDVDDVVEADRSDQSEEGDDGNESDDEEGTAEDDAEVEDEDERELDHLNDHQSEEPSSHMWVWGRPPSLEGGTPLVLRPKQVSLLNGQPIVQVACGGEHLLYLTSTGDVYSYGDNEDKKAAAVTIATNANSADNDYTRSISKELALEKALHRTTIAMISCGAQHSLAITDAGELYTWGSGEDGRLGHGDMRDRAVPRKVMSLLRESVASASCGLGDNKWRDTPHQIVGFPQGTRISNVVCGWNFTAALDRQGNIFTWGKTGEGQCGLGYVDKDQVVPRCVEKLREVAAGSAAVDVACGYTHTVVLTASGELYSWGLGEYGQLARVQLPSDALCAPDQLTRVYCGAFHSIATTEKRVMFAWGLNSYGACGLGHTANKDKPERIDCFSSQTELVVACGHKYTIALEVDPALYGHSSSSSHAMVRTGAAVDGLAIPRTQRQVSEGSEASEDDPFFGRGSPGRPTTPTVGTRRHRRGSPPTLAMDLGEAPREAIHEKEEELRRAKKLWRTRILRDWEENKDTPLAHSLWRQGIPPSIRARVWPMAIGNKLKVTPEMFKIYRRRAAAYKKDRAAKEKNDDVDGGREHTLALIDTDLPRTFPSLKLFDSSGPYYAFLLEVLETYACYRPDLGYIQGMSYLAAMLCLHMPQDRYLAFQCLANLMVNEHLFTFYLLDADLANVYYTLFDTFLNSRLPHLHAHLREIGVFSCSMYLMNWLQTLFLQVLPLESAARVFDNFLLDGTVFLFRTAMAIHELLAPQLLAAEIDVALPLLQRNVIYQDEWNARVSEQSLFDTVATIAVPSHIYSALDRVVNDVFFYEKRGDPDSIGGKKMMAFASGGQSVGIGHVKHERRRMYAISDALNGVLGGF
ncbi:hypothetical protein PHYSODRAFT_258036 [Phytophthora sojae]|uniref:Rab-GAP TBC domain-containing protein n=1 Tax=Phytophthora sojae (strain P6497) TaxID=1094619 RepID=G4Z106_PHYSP|nr:hypothetical protein PHYSODRAFT_258036 [Phytophthora sojae]EGZ23431.1 hypothetical protein PHYSODRAFT_258036 [Phytophthora sojae]|eukprot:XP_009518719.1 hypothetical protein PHYSODRAFT_258036 [Phytophthora sojae]